MWKREITDRDPAVMWDHLLEEASPSDALILVNNLLMEREVRRKWQRDKQGLAPDIRTLTSWLEELALHTLDEQDIPKVILSVEERSLWLEQWLSGHERKDFRRFAGRSSVTAISNIIGELYRENQHPGALLQFLHRHGSDGPGTPETRSEPGTVLRKATNKWQQNAKNLQQDAKSLQQDANGSRSKASQLLLAELLSDYEQKLAENNWMDQEQLIAKMSRFDLRHVRHRKWIFYLMDEIEPLQERVLQLIAEMNGPEMVAIRHDDTADLPSPDRTGMAVFHHPREELESAVRHIIIQIGTQDLPREAMQDHEAPEMMEQVTSKRDGQNGSAQEGMDRQLREGRHSIGTRFDDFVILTGDLSLYEDMVPALSDRFGVPLYVSRGPALISHPFIRRILIYLKLDHNEFQIDDVFRVFADNRLVLPDLKDNDEQKAPNIRHFSQFCRAYNFRTLQEASEGMDRVFDSLLEHIVYEEDEEREERRRDGLRRDRLFYADVIRHLEALRTHYKTPERQPLREWVAWIRGLLDLQADLMSREANEARHLLEIILEKLAAAQDRIGLTRKISRFDFFKLLELRLKETRERPAEQPGGVLLTEVRHLPEVHDKIVFVLGMHEDGFPKSERPDFLQFRYEKAIRHLTGREGTESHDLARKQLDRLLASSMFRYLSRPAYVGQKQVMPSPLWLDLEERRTPAAGKAGSGKEAPKTWPYRHLSGDDFRTSWLITKRDAGEWLVRQRAPSAVSRIPEEMQATGKHYLISALAEKQRRDVNSMGRYDGIIDQGIMDRWWEQQGLGNRMTMSISRLDTFATSPQEYFFRYVLRLQPLHEYCDDAESNIKGALLHHILQDFYTETGQEGPPVWPADDPEAARKRMDSIRERLVDDYHHQLGNPESPFPGILKNNLERVTRRFVELEQEYHPYLADGLDDLRPAGFYPDSGFTMEQRWSFEKPVDAFTVAFHGKIDRIDITADGKKALIYDYKSGGAGVQTYRGKILNGLSFQLPVYGMYLHNNGIPYFLAGYYKLPVNGKVKDIERIFSMGSAELVDDGQLFGKGGKRLKRSLQYKSAEAMADFMAATHELRITWIVQAMRRGHFHVTLTGEPGWSDFRHITRHEDRIQMQRKNIERTRRKNKGMEFELDRYYLNEPFWEDAADE